MPSLLAYGAARRAAALDRPVSALADACSRYVGLVTHVDELLAAPDDSRLTHVVAVGTDRRDALDPGGTGYAADPAVARAAAIGEALERYAAAEPPPGLPLARTSELEQAVDPARFALFSPEQHARPDFPFVPFTRRTLVRWTAGRSLASGRRVFLPAQLVYLAWDALAEGEEAIGYSTSSGLACAGSFAEAALAALLELVERDAFLLVWRHRLSLPLLDASAEPDLVAWERLHLAPTRLRHDVVDLSVVHRVPTALAVVRDSAGSLGVGASAAADAHVAYRRALAEAYASHGAARRMRPALGEDELGQGAVDVVTFGDHIRVYADPRNAERAAFLTTSSVRHAIAEVDPLEGDDAQAQLDALVDRLLEGGVEPYAVDVTTEDVAELGLHVVRAVTPELCPLDVRQDACFLGGTRLRDAPSALGLAPEAGGELNLDPHPFP